MKTSISRKNRTQALEELRFFVERVAPLTGDQLPDERALASELACSRQTLRSALAILEAEGQIWRHVGKGTFRGARPFGHPIRENVLIEASSPAQLMRARILIEPQIAAEAALVATASDLQHLARLVSQGRRATSRAECEQADMRFHRGVAELAGNPVLLSFLDHLSGVRRRATWQREWDQTYRRVGVDEFTSHHSAQHQAVLDAIAVRDGLAAEQAMRLHLETIVRAMRADQPFIPPAVRPDTTRS